MSVQMSRQDLICIENCAHFNETGNLMALDSEFGILQDGKHGVPAENAVESGFFYLHADEFTKGLSFGGGCGFTQGTQIRDDQQGRRRRLC